MSAHTPGPWHSSFKTNKTNNLGVYGGDGKLIADIDVHQIAPAEVLARRKLDARLIAAAPDLLAACQAYISDRVEAGCVAESPAVKAMRAAIAKATGQAS